MYLSVKSVEPAKNYKLYLTFENEERRIFDMTPYLNTGIFRELRDERMFNTVRVNFDSIEWANEADIDPEILYEKSIAVE